MILRKILYRSNHVNTLRSTTINNTNSGGRVRIISTNNNCHENGFDNTNNNMEPIHVSVMIPTTFTTTISEFGHQQKNQSRRWSVYTNTSSFAQRLVQNSTFNDDTFPGTSSRRSFSSVPLPTGPYDQSIPGGAFPSLIIGSQRDSIQAVGSFAVAQAEFLQPDVDAVNELVQYLIDSNSGIVAHYYMDVELQGVLQAAKQKLPGRIGIADSLKMGDMAVDMVQNHNCTAIACLGVDFMSESVAAILGKNGYPHVPVYRATSAKIGCSLAESAERDSYRAWLQHEANPNDVNALHVIYINTSLETKAVSASIVPTITCTSSNVLQTLLVASAQIHQSTRNSTNQKPFRILYGPDTYMGENLVTMLTTLLADRSWDDQKIATNLHPHHNRESLTKLRDSIVVYPSGNCVVHHMFGQSVVNTVKEYYNDCYVTAHLEVPGEMFEIAMQKSLQDKGVVGSTSDILNFISRKVREAVHSSNHNNQQKQKRLRFILGTEAGMVTSIVQSVQLILKEADCKDIEAEIIFPVASEAFTSTSDDSTTDNQNSTGLALVPGVPGGEGCSTAGGCATCPFMKMNNLDALLHVLGMIKTATSTNNTNKDMIQQQQKVVTKLRSYLPPDKLGGKMITGRSALEWGTQPIVYMRYLNIEKVLPQELVDRILQQQQQR